MYRVHKLSRSFIKELNGIQEVRSSILLSSTINEISRLGSKSWPVFLYENSDIQEGCTYGRVDEEMGEVEEGG